MNEKERKIWDETIKLYSKATGKPKKIIQDSLTMNEMEIALKIMKTVKIIHGEVIKSDRPKSQLMSAIGEIIRPFPKEEQMDILFEVVKRLDEMNKFGELTGEKNERKEN